MINEYVIKLIENLPDDIKNVKEYIFNNHIKNIVESYIT